MTPLQLFAWLMAGACGACVPGGDIVGGAGGAGSTAMATTASAAASVATTASGSPSKLSLLLAALEGDRDAALQQQSDAEGWPAAVEGGWLFVSADQVHDKLAGDFNDWQPEPMNLAKSFAWKVVSAGAGSRYKFSDGKAQWGADRWSRAYSYDQYGEMSLVPPVAGGHLQRFFAVKDAHVAPRTVRVWLPVAKATRVLYLHDGQNLFDPGAPWGGWKLQASVPSGIMLVAIDNTAARMNEYTHVKDDLGKGAIGGAGDAYADFVDGTVRALIAKHYGEPSLIATMGSSLGGLASLVIADRFAGKYRFVVSLSGTLGWGSIGKSVHNETIIERHAARGHQTTAIYLDSGGGGLGCADADNDGIDDDDPTASDNYCENRQLQKVLAGAGYQQGKDLWHWHEPGAPHNEAAWAARAWRPLQIFSDLK